MLPPELQNGNGQPPPEAPEVGPDVEEMIDELGRCVVSNAQQAAGAPSPEASQKFADAALKACQAINSLVPYRVPGAPGDTQTNNPAKKGD